MIKLILWILGIIATIGGIIYAWREDYINLEQIKESLGLEGMKDMIITIFSQPTFLFIYIVFVFPSIWIIPNYFHIANIPIYQKILLSIGCIFAVNWIMEAKDLK